MKTNRKDHNAPARRSAWLASGLLLLVRAPLLLADTPDPEHDKPSSMLSFLQEWGRTIQIGSALLLVVAVVVFYLLRMAPKRLPPAQNTRQPLRLPPDLGSQPPASEQIHQDDKRLQS